MVVGESQILGQVRAAYGTAREAGTVGRTLHELIQRALRVGKRVHSETGLDKAGGSVVSEALADADRLLGGLAGRRALLVGAGSMGGLAAAALRRAGIGEIVVANRTESTGARLAELQREQGVPATRRGPRRAGRPDRRRRPRRLLHRRERHRHRHRRARRADPPAGDLRPRPAA